MGKVLKRGDAESAEEMLEQELCALSASAFLLLTQLSTLLVEPAASALRVFHADGAVPPVAASLPFWSGTRCTAGICVLVKKSCSVSQVVRPI